MIHKPLGRGLDALIESTVPENTSMGANVVTMVELSRIVPGPFQPRQYFDQGRLEELRRAIEAQGVIEPLVVRPADAPGTKGDGRYELIAGERRLRAARAAGLEAVPVVVRALDDRAALEMSVVENIAREELNPVEEGRALSRLGREFGLSHEEIAARIGKSRPYVSNAIRILDLPEPVLEMIARGELTAGHARPLLALSSVQAQVAAARRIVEGAINVRGAEEIASARRRARRNGGVLPRASDPNLNALAENLQRALRRKVRVIRRRGKTPGRIEMEYYDDDDLTALARMLAGASHAIVARV